MQPQSSLAPAIGRGVEGLKGYADSSEVHLRAREESGFGLLELLMAMVMLNIGILAVVAAFSAGSTALARASRISTAVSLAEKQLEVYRGLKYDNIVFITAEWNSALTDSAYTADTVYQQNMLNPVSPKALVATVSPCPANVPASACDPSYTITGPDQRSYKIDTYLYYDTPTGGNQIKTVTVVVRDAADATRSYARISSVFDLSTGS
jgi:type II secretory pathway pseudopilin PulG